MFACIVFLALSIGGSTYASEIVATGFHLGINVDSGLVTSSDKQHARMFVSTGELEIGFQSENGFLVNGMFHSGYWGERYRSDKETQTWRTSGGGAQVGWRVKRIRLLTGYQWAAVERESSSEEYSTVNDGHYYGPNAGFSIVLIDRPGINLDVGARSSFLRWDDREDKEGGRNLVMTTAGVHLHLYPSHWRSRDSGFNGHFWLHFPIETTRFLMEFGPRLTLEILRAAAQIR